MIELIMNRRLFIILFLLSSIYLFLSYIPNIYEAQQAKNAMPDRHVILAEHIYTYDYNVYLSKIRQGLEDRLSVINKYDNQPQSKGIYLQMLYLLSGKLGGLFSLSPGIIFHLMRTIFSIIWIAVIVYLAMLFIKDKFFATLAVLFSLLSSSFPIIEKINDQPWISMYMSWWQELDPVKRISYLPHYTINYIIISLLTILLYLHGKTGKTKYFYAIVVILFFSFFIHPSGGLVFLGSWILYHLIYFLWFRTLNTKYQILNTIKMTFILFLTASIPLLYIKVITSGYPWRSLVEFDRLHPMPFVLKDYILAVGPLFFTGMLGALLVLIKKNKDLLAVTTWILAANIGIIVFMKFTTQSPTRFIQVANHVPLAILSIYFISWLLTLTTNNAGGAKREVQMNASADDRFIANWDVRRPREAGSSRPTESGKRVIKRLLLTFISYSAIALILLLGILQSYFSIKAQNLFNFQKAVAGQPIVAYPPQVTHPEKDVYNGYLWLKDNTDHDAIVLSKINAGNYIPAYSGNFVYFGHNPETPDYDKREQEVNQFFSLALKEAEARKFLIDRDISYIYYGPQERETAGWQYPTYSFLKPVYTSPWVNIYQVAPQTTLDNLQKYI